MPFDEEDGNPFIVDECDVPSTPSPTKRPSAGRRGAVSRYDGDEGDKVINDENVNPFCTPTLSMPPSMFSSPASPKRRRRKRGRAEEEVEGLDEGNVTFSVLADHTDALRARLPKTRATKESVEVATPVKKRPRREAKQSESTRGKSDKDVVDVGYGEDEENVKEVKAVRRSTRLSKQGPLADSNSNTAKKTKAGKTTARATKGKGNENAGKRASAVTKGKGKARNMLRIDEAPDDVIETVSFCLRVCDEC